MTNELLAYQIAGVEDGNPILDFGQVPVSIFTMPYLLQIFFTEVFPGEPERLEPVWGMLAANPNPMNMPKLSRIKYGELPAGYELRQAPEPLEKGSYYAVGVSKLILHKIDDNKFETIDRDQFDKLPKPAVSKPVRVIESVAPQDNFAPGDGDDDMDLDSDSDSDSHYESPSKKKASQKALELLQDDYFWSCADEASPFGSDEGADLFNRYASSATSLETPDGVEFLKAMCESWDLQPGSLADLQVAASDNPAELPPAILAEAAAFRESIPSVDSMDSQLAELGLPPEMLQMMKSTGAMNNVLVGTDVRDMFAIGLAFAQLVLFGDVQPQVLDYALMAIRVRLKPRPPEEQQASPIVIERLKEWQPILEKLRN